MSRLAERRLFLRALGAGAAALPFFRLLEHSAAVAAPGDAPLRVLLICSAYGGRWEYFRPQGLPNTSDPLLAADEAITAESISYPNAALAPLAPFASQMTVVEGIASLSALIPVDESDPVNTRTNVIGHEGHASSLWTGSAVSRPKDNDAGILPSSASIDYTLGQQLGAATAVRNIQLGIGTLVTPGQDSSASMTYNELGQRVPGFSNPADAFDLLFGNMPVLPGDDLAAARAKARDQSVIQGVKTSAERLRSRLAGQERSKLDEHLAALADIEAHLSGAGSAVACTTPSKPVGSTDMLEATRGHLSLIRQAFACDRVRYASVVWGEGGPPIPGVLDPSITDLHNQIAHVVGDDGAAGDAARLNTGILQRWFAEQIAGLMADLAADPDVDGTSVLDNTLIVWAQDFGQDVHGGQNIPHVLLGGAQKKLRMGRYLNVRKAQPEPAWDNPYISYDLWRTCQPNNKLLVSILNACGIQTDSYGSGDYTGPLPGLLA